MIFIDEEHKFFWEEKMKFLKKYHKENVYYQSIIYILGLCHTTREHFEDIFDIQNGEINISSLQYAFQTDTSRKVTRMAFNLWNGYCYENNDEQEMMQVSPYYNVNKLFCCEYATYFYEGIKIRYPKFAK